MLRSAGCAVEYTLTPLKADKQFKRALELQCAFTAKMEPSVGAEDRVVVKNLKTRAEQSWSVPEAVQHLAAARQAGR